ncbi:16S rRNA (uracil(1498)-N(3))-methyltransferase [Corynebacterium pseudotuberculosis]|uniref:16S rRNA (uracil(1498)-N(3))-methyltransferase n=1 Tax=Corynebacterium pseudotuberculosis TaxID=1719 RepID=UPI0007192136|nr:16S rRNA (uracil(1498)-N(3))-methyltransferase [Corynebacterium pseudotuberculosis]ALP34193.1 16S ribosomal RNA methyltransferase RsmE [Corynebacterium pseudotuberculosis]ALR34132.1 Ribosomal RNA small subunit methyltransferase E [Corynebacterium pseudotuberculosis]AQL51647.1 Ribosomal RNA small subunit methyltransferase E [Corynebacterium pseudotuberculosis]ATQ65876.1 Ribosomal RNA small subunit methyltransferase E [Corynebacterium pseudotuberculosis]ATQ81795.1 16S ribosomal RNA methyltran
MSLPTFVYDLDAVLQGQRPRLPEVGEIARLDGAEGRHAVSVKRIVAGERIKLIDAHGAYAEALVTETSGKDRLAARVEISETQSPVGPSVTVFQAIPKSERSELAVDLLTQGGVDAIVPWEAQRCVAKWSGTKREKSVQKWRAAAVAAAKQSRRSAIPTIGSPINTSELALRLKTEGFDLVLMLHEDAQQAFAALPLQQASSIALIIGPEGGIGQEESSELQAAGARLAKLGPEVLRTASAGIVALAAIGVLTSRW